MTNKEYKFRLWEELGMFDIDYWLAGCFKQVPDSVAYRSNGYWRNKPQRSWKKYRRTQWKGTKPS